jgi:hypothetical protein
MTGNDLPDNYPWLAGSSRSTVVDVGELAVRLGSPVTYDRRGEVLFADQFGHGLGSYTAEVDGTGASIKLIASEGDCGGYAAQLTGGSVDGDFVSLVRTLPATARVRYGFEVSFWLPSVVSLVDFMFQYYDGALLRDGHLRYTWSPAGWSYRDAAGAYQSISIPALYVSTDPLFHWLKLVVDLSKDEYLRILVDEEEYDMSGVGLYSVANATPPNMACGVFLASPAGVNNRIVLGRFILTGNET